MAFWLRLREVQLSLSISLLSPLNYLNLVTNRVILIFFVNLKGLSLVFTSEKSKYLYFLYFFSLFNSCFCRSNNTPSPGKEWFSLGRHSYAPFFSRGLLFTCWCRVDGYLIYWWCIYFMVNIILFLWWMHFKNRD